MDRLTTALQAVPPIKILDVADFADRCDFDGELAQMLVGYFREGTVRHLDAVDVALSQGDVETVRKHAHAIKGSASNLSATLLRDASAWLEKAASDELADAAIATRLAYEQTEPYLDNLAECVKSA